MRGERRHELDGFDIGCTWYENGSFWGVDILGQRWEASEREYVIAQLAVAYAEGVIDETRRSRKYAKANADETLHNGESYRAALGRQ